MLKEYCRSVEFCVGTALALLMWLIPGDLNIYVRICIIAFILIASLIFALAKRMLYYKKLYCQKQSEIEDIKKEYIQTTSRLKDSVRHWSGSSKKNASKLELFEAYWSYLGAIIAATRPNTNKERLDYIFECHQKLTAELIKIGGQSNE